MHVFQFLIVFFSYRASCLTGLVNIDVVIV
jgi:hypothetical protein